MGMGVTLRGTKTTAGFYTLGFTFGFIGVIGLALFLGYNPRLLLVRPFEAPRIDRRHDIRGILSGVALLKLANNHHRHRLDGYA